MAQTRGSLFCCLLVFSSFAVHTTRCHQGGISGNKEEGCDAIVVSGARKDGKGEDNFDALTYAATTKVGAGSMMRSKMEGKVIRVFRSSATAIDSPFRAQCTSSKKNMYRYDGLYTIDNILCDHGNGRDVPVKDAALPKLVKKPSSLVYSFCLSRVECGEGPFKNQQSVAQIQSVIEKDIATNQSACQ